MDSNYEACGMITSESESRNNAGLKNIPYKYSCVFHVETTRKRSFTHRFNVEYTWSVYRVMSKMSMK